MQKKIEALYDYMMSWENSGSYKSLIVHRGNLKRVSNIHDTPWVQGPMIEALLEIYKNSNDEQVLEKLIQAITVQAKNISVDGSYKNAGHEDDRFSSLIHNCLASIALSKVIYTIDEEKLGLSMQLAKKAIEANMSYILNILYNKEDKVFIFDKNDFYTESNNHYVLNMNAILLEFIVLYEDLFELDLYEYSNSIITYLDEEINNDFIPYSNLRPDIEIAIYTALIGRGLIEFYIRKNTSLSLEFNKKMLNLLNQVNISLENSILPNNLFIHGRKKVKDTKIIETHPIFLAGSGIILDYLYRLNQLELSSNFWNPNLKKISSDLLNFQSKNGGVKNYIGYYTKENYRKINVNFVWEDETPTPGWNGFLLLALLKIYNDEIDFSLINKKSIQKSITFNSKFFSFENQKHFLLFSWFPLLSIAIYFVSKTKDTPFFWFDIRRIKKIIKKNYYVN